MHPSVSSSPASALTHADAWAEGASRSMSLGAHRVTPPVLMAPMADVTDSVFHEVLRELGGPGLYTAEMVSCEALVAGQARPARLVRRPRRCPVFAVQVYGSDPAGMAAAAELAVEAGADIVDVNLGCPAKAITGKLCGSGLLRDTALIAAIFRRMRRSLPDSVPLTAKIRKGWDERSENFLEVAAIAEGEGLAGLTMHGRTRAQQYSGECDRDAIARLVRGTSLPVVGNGDVRSPADALEMLRETGCAGVMIARGALANPWIFRQLRDLHEGRAPREPDHSERRRVVLDHFERLEAQLEPKEALHRVRKFLGLYLRGLPEGRRLARRLSSIETADDFRSEVDAFFDDLAHAA